MERFGLTTDEMEELCGEAYRRAMTANPERYPEMLTSPLPLSRADDGRVVLAGDQNRDRADKTPNDADARGGGTMAFVRQFPSRVQAATQQSAPMAWVELRRSAGLGVKQPAVGKQSRAAFMGLGNPRPAGLIKGKF